MHLSSSQKQWPTFHLNVGCVLQKYRLSPNQSLPLPEETRSTLPDATLKPLPRQTADESTALASTAGDLRAPWLSECVRRLLRAILTRVVPLWIFSDCNGMGPNTGSRPNPICVANVFSRRLKLLRSAEIQKQFQDNRLLNNVNFCLVAPAMIQITFITKLLLVLLLLLLVRLLLLQL